MGIVKLVELIDENLIVKPIFFGLKEFYNFSSEASLYYYSFNKGQVNLKGNFRYFLNPMDEEGSKHIQSGDFHMDSYSYYGLILQEIINNLNKDHGQNFKDLEDLKNNYSCLEFEYENLYGKRVIYDMNYSDSENEILDKYHSCKKFILTMAAIHQNFSNVKIYSKYFEEVDIEIKSLRDKRIKIENVKLCDHYFLKSYGF